MKNNSRSPRTRMWCGAGTRFLAACLLAGGLLLDAGAAGAAPTSASVSLPMGASQTLTLGYHKTKIIDLPRNARDVIVSDPRIATAVLRDSRRIFLTGVTVGQADLFVLDQQGQQILHLALQVERDIAALEASLRRLVPNGNIRVEVINDNVVLSGTVKNASDSMKAQQLAEMFANGSQNTGLTVSQSSTAPSEGGTGSDVGSNAQGKARMSNIVNLLTIEGEDQVQLKVTVAEINRNVAKQLGINLAGAAGSGGNGIAGATNNPFAINGPLFDPVNQIVGQLVT
ncbi:MAG: pilus assembly protein N-terminal domain-containing protein, partial [Rhizobiales bacterium]|nr:pilus assembly protein N-terminal domain-containing protein [Hyphomicrobiales bacterium]